METASISEAEARYLDRVVEDCVDMLGPGVEVDDIEVDHDTDVVLRLRYRLGAVAWSSEAHGTTLVEAHAGLREQLVLDRARMATVALYRAARRG